MTVQKLKTFKQFSRSQLARVMDLTHINVWYRGVTASLKLWPSLDKENLNFFLNTYTMWDKNLVFMNPVQKKELSGIIALGC